METRAYFSNSELNNVPAEEIAEQIRIIQESRLYPQLRYCYDNSDFYRSKFKEAGAVPEDIRTLEDLRTLPIFMTKDVERENALESRAREGHPFGTHLCIPVKDLYLTGTTSGTTGVPTFTYSFTRNDIELISKGLGHRFALAGIKKGDRVLFIFALGIYATTMSLWGLRGIGALPIDIDARAGSELMLRFADLTTPDYMVTTPSLAEYLIKKSPEVLGKEIGDLNFKGVITGGEVGLGIPEVKRKLESAYRCRFYDYWAPCGHGIAISCDSDEYHGMHAVSPDLCTTYEDLVDPETKKPVESKNGAVGEMVITSLKREAAPVIKYAYGDIVQIFTEPCPNCGFPGKRARFIGRADDMLVVKGVNVYPAAIKEIVCSYVPRITGEMRIILDAPPPRVVPPLKLKLEHGEQISKDEFEGLAEEISKDLHDKLKIRPLIQWVPPGSFEKSTRKSPIFEKAYEKK